MRKAWKQLGICFLAVVTVWTLALIRDRQMLRQELVRLHVVAASDSAEDQAVKLRVKDAVVNSLKADLEKCHSAEEASAYLQENLPKIEALSNRILREAGCIDVAKASLKLEEFPTRDYDTFSLPAGIYQALRITIGEGEGHNWWCVAFPGLCLPATTSGFEDAASCAGLSDGLTATLEEKPGYEIRFWLLDALGCVENFLHLK
jgi:stage II sporulation protein R